MPARNIRRSAAIFMPAVLLLLTSTIVHSADSDSEPEQRTAERPRVNVGDHWVYVKSAFGREQHHIDFLVERVEADAITVSHGPTSSVFTNEWNWVSYNRGDDALIQIAPFRATYSFPLFVGKSWRSHHTEKHVHATQRWDLHVTVEAIERVTVPAGTFEAFRLRLHGATSIFSEKTHRNVAEGYSEHVWYAPSVQRHVKSVVETMMPGANGMSLNNESEELVAFTKGADPAVVK